MSGFAESPDFRPLYLQVKDLMIRRLVSGDWRPGELLPSEMRLAEELKVSQGTVRKALDEMAAQNLLVRRQGRGTYVAEHSPSRSLFHFFHIVEPNGAKALPTSRLIARSTSRATRTEEEKLDLQPGARVIRMLRERLFDARPAILERISIPADLFKGFDLALGSEMASELYVIYQQRHGVTIVNADERLRAVGAEGEECEYLKVAPGTPLLEIDRLAFSLDGRPVEWRVSRCETSERCYRTRVE